MRDHYKKALSFDIPRLFLTVWQMAIFPVYFRSVSCFLFIPTIVTRHCSSLIFEFMYLHSGQSKLSFFDHHTQIPNKYCRPCEKSNTLNTLGTKKSKCKYSDTLQNKTSFYFHWEIGKTFSLNRVLFLDVSSCETDA